MATVKQRLKNDLFFSLDLLFERDWTEFSGNTDMMHALWNKRVENFNSRKLEMPE